MYMYTYLSEFPKVKSDFPNLLLYFICPTFSFSQAQCTRSQNITEGETTGEERERMC